MLAVRPLLLAAALILCAPTARTQATETLRGEIERLNREMSQAAAVGDMKRAASYYADNAIIRTPRTIAAQGRAAVDRYFTSLENVKSWNLEVFDVHGTRDVAYQVGRSTLVYGMPERTSVVDFFLVWKRQADGKLRVEVDYYHAAPR